MQKENSQRHQSQRYCLGYAKLFEIRLPYLVNPEDLHKIRNETDERQH